MIVTLPSLPVLSSFACYVRETLVNVLTMIYNYILHLRYVGSVPFSNRKRTQIKNKNLIRNKKVD